jgi:hypothetical protein
MRFIIGFRKDNKTSILEDVSEFIIKEGWIVIKYNDGRVQEFNKESVFGYRELKKD